MKRLLLFSALLGSIVLVALKVNAQPFQSAIITETTYPAANASRRANNTSAYSYGNLNIGGNITHLYVYTWDNLHSSGTPITGAGLAVRQTFPFAQSFNPTGWPVNDVASAEAVILQSGSDVYILATYYWISKQGFYVDLYQYTGGGVLSQQPGYPLNITAFGLTAPLGRIHLDAHGLNEFLVTWEQQNQILTKAGTAASGISMGNTAMLNNSAIGIPAAAQPDVALIRSQQAGNQVRAHFVYTNPAFNQLFVTQLNFNTILTAPPPAPNPALLTPMLNDMQGTTGIYGLPRIDAPDNYPDDDWSYAVENYVAAAQTDNIYVGLRNGGGLLHFNLTDAIWPPFAALLDISATAPATPHQNTFPAVAYNNTGDNIYYCWNYNSSWDQPYPGSDLAYIGLKIDNTGNLLGPSFQYWRTQFFPQNTSTASPSIALSGQNDASPDGLFMAFTQYDQTSTIFSMGSKVVPWSATSFRPGPPSRIAETDQLRIYPNPFTANFQIIAEQNNQDTYRMEITGISGQKILSLTGKISELNIGLSADPGSLSPGNYLMSLVNVKTQQQNTFKLAKIK